MIPENIPWQLMADLTLIVLTATALLALAGLPVMAVAGQTLARLRQRSSYDKCGRQLAVLAASLGWLLVFGGAYAAWVRLSPLMQRSAGQLTETVDAATQATGPFISFFGQTFAITAQAQADMLVWLVLVCGTFFVSMYVILWRTLRQSPALHQTLGLLGTIFCYTAIYGVMSVLCADAAFELGEAKPETLRSIFLPAETSTLWNGLSYLLPLTLSMAGGLGALWLVVRRHRDDYGRDYYTQMLPWCTLWARYSWIVLWMMLVGFTAINLWHISLDGEQMEFVELSRYGARLLLWLIPGLLWTIVARSKTPLRHKLTLLLALLLAMGFEIPVYMGLVTIF